jgi:hypothetical protein
MPDVSQDAPQEEPPKAKGAVQILGAWLSVGYNISAFEEQFLLARVFTPSMCGVYTYM